MMRAPFTVGLSLAFCTQALAFGEHLKEGKYVCLSDRAAGIQGRADQRYAGKIELTDNRRRFFVAVERIRDFSDKHPCGADGCNRLPSHTRTLLGIGITGAPKH